jgi:acetyl esterase/lipase
MRRILLASLLLLCACGRSPTAPAISTPPQRADIDPFFRPISTDGSIEYAYGPDRDQRLDLRVPTGTTPAPLVILVHGGGWTAGDKRTSPSMVWYSDAFLASGFATASLDYRLTRNPEPVDDVELAIDWIASHAPTFGIDATRCAILGESAGGHIGALAVFSRGKCSAFVGFAGIYDLTTPDFSFPTLPGWVGCPLASCPLRWIDASPALSINRAAPAMLMWGTADELVPNTQALAMSRALGGAGVYVLNGARHTGPEWTTPQVAADVTAFLRRWLQRS